MQIVNLPIPSITAGKFEAYHLILRDPLLSNFVRYRRVIKSVMNVKKN